MSDPLILDLFVFLAAVLLGGALIAAFSHGRIPGRRAAAPVDGNEGTSFLFDQAELMNATGPGLAFLKGLRLGGEASRTAVLEALEPRFPGLVEEALAATGTGRARIAGTYGDAGIDLEWWNGMLRLTLIGEGDAQTSVHPVTLRAMEEDVALLGLLADETPHPIWRTDDEGRITWTNRSYLDLVDATEGNGGTARTWPPPTLFAAHRDAGEARVSIALDDGTERWFDLTVRRAGRDSLYIGTPADAAVGSEALNRSFVATMGRTFADLAIGLAIFDRDRALVTFNPALLDLTGLKPEFLVGKPNIRSFLDRLRDLKMLPEPKDYSGWREEVAKLEAAAERGTYAETWALPGGQTYRVIGRPHPDGAIAFLFEDISAEIALTRQYRDELETAQLVLDSVEDAIAVFAPSGALRLSNAGYADLWGSSADGLGDIRFLDELEGWRLKCAPSPVWDEMRRPRTASTGEPRMLRLMDGRAVRCILDRLRSGDTIVRFSLPRAAEPERIEPEQVQARG